VGVSAPDNGAVDVEDTDAGATFRWQGKIPSALRLDPAELPFRVWRIARKESAMNAPLAAPSCRSLRSLWYKDAIIYQLHVKSSFDA